MKNPKAKKQKPAKKKKSTALAVRAKTNSLAKRGGVELAEELDEIFRTKGSRLKATEAFLRAAAAVAPYFGITNRGSSDKPQIDVPDAKIAAEVLCSAGLWLGARNGIPKAELAALVEKWALENGY